MLKIEKLRKSYDDFTLNCSMEVRSGCVTGLIGRNGAGKSTTFKAVLNLIRPDDGSIQIFGKEASSLLPEDRERLGVVLSDSGFSSYLTIRDIAHILKAMYKKFHLQQFTEQCKKSELPLNKKLKDFSTGMKAKLKILIALSHEADLLILDEPTVGLDVIAREEVLGLLRDYMEEDDRRTILISSHISSDLEGFCDDFYMINEGSIMMHEEMDCLLDNYALLKVSLQQFEQLDKRYIKKYEKETYGYRCLTDEKQFYLENYPEIVVEKGNMDDLMILMIGGSEL